MPGRPSMVASTGSGPPAGVCEAAVFEEGSHHGRLCAATHDCGISSDPSFSVAHSVDGHLGPDYMLRASIEVRDSRSS